MISIIRTLPGNQLTGGLLKRWLRVLDSGKPFNAAFEFGKKKKSRIKSEIYRNCGKVATLIRVRYDVT